MSERFNQIGGGGGVSGGGESHVLPFYHVPQQSRREKLRYPTNDVDLSPPPHLLPSASPSNFVTTHHATPLFMGPSSASASLPLINPSYSATATGHYDHTGVGVAVGGMGNFMVRGHLDDNNHHHHPLFSTQLGPVSLSLSSHYNVDPRMVAVPRTVAPTEPFTGYTAVLKSSRFLRPAQQMLEEICDVGGVGRCDGSIADLTLDAVGGSDASGVIAGVGEQGRVKSRLISMMEEVHRRYKQYCQQIQYVISSFESVAGLSNAAPYTFVALKSMSKHFRCLKDAISDQLRVTDKAVNKEGHCKEGMHGYGPIGGGLCYQGMTHSSGGIGQPNVWRPQRGLPERAVAVLKAWLFEHFLHPYPTDTDKHMLAKQTGLSRNQVSNWFINARVRLWKPLVEEIHSLEMRQARNKGSDADSNHGANQQTQLPSSSTEPNSSKQPMQNVAVEKNEDPPYKRFRNEFTELPNHMDEPLAMSYDDFPSHHRLGAGLAIPSRGSNDISLTLGLHQNNGICMQDPLPLNVARRFGLEETSTSFVMGGFEAQDRQFSKDIDGQLLRDFVG